MPNYLDMLAIGDPHMDGVPSFLPEELRRSAFRQVFTQALSYCLGKNIRHMVWLGDVFHGYPPSLDAQGQVVEMDAELSKHGIQLYIIDGNHGYVRKGVTSLSLLEELAEMGKMDAKIYTGEGRAETIEGESVVFLPWPCKDVAGLAERPSLVFAHVDRPGAKLANGFIMEGIEDFPMGNHEWVMGHNHTPQTHYVGAPLPLKWGDGNRRRFWHIRMKDGVVKKKNVLIDNPYNLEDLWAEKESDLGALAKRAENTWTRVKLGADLMGRSREIETEYPRVVCQPVPRTVAVSADGDGSEDSAGQKQTFMEEGEFARQYFTAKAKEMAFTKEKVSLMNAMLKEAAV